MTIPFRRDQENVRFHVFNLDAGCFRQGRMLIEGPKKLVPVLCVLFLIRADAAKESVLPLACKQGAGIILAVIAEP